MKATTSFRMLLGCLLMFGLLLAGCATTDNNSGTQTNSQHGEQTDEQGEEVTENGQAIVEERTVTDYLNREVVIPGNPQKIIYFDGNTMGDLLALGIKPIGADGRYFPGAMVETVYPDMMEGVVDVGFPINLEAVLDLEPDLIIVGLTLTEEQIEALSRVAPVVFIHRDAPVAERLMTLAELVNKQAEAEAWIVEYERKVAQMWASLADEITPGETATSFMYAYGKQFYVMSRGITSTIYHEQGFRPHDKVVSDLYDAEVQFLEISEELLPEFAGSRIFLNIPSDAETEQAAEELMNGVLWKSLPAVQADKVYFVASKWTLFDAITYERFLDELPRLLKQE